MKYRMNLNKEPFDKIKNKKKYIEVRCYDKKRKSISIGDEICFYKLPEKRELIRVKILDLIVCKSFEELYSKYDFEEFGCKNYTMKRMLDETRAVYSLEREKEQGVLGIRIELI